MFLLLRLRGPYCLRFTGLCLTGPKPKGIKVETFRIDCLMRTPTVEKLSLQPISLGPKTILYKAFGLF